MTAGELNYLVKIINKITNSSFDGWFIPEQRYPENFVGELAKNLEDWYNKNKEKLNGQ